MVHFHLPVVCVGQSELDAPRQPSSSSVVLHKPPCNGVVENVSDKDESPLVLDTVN